MEISIQGWIEQANENYHEQQQQQTDHRVAALLEFVLPGCFSDVEVFHISSKKDLNTTEPTDIEMEVNG